MTMFRKMKNIDTAFRDYRRYTLVVICGSLLAVCFMAYECKSLIASLQSKIYLLYNNTVLSAVASDRRDNLAVEARGQVHIFHELFFTLDPDDKVIQANVTKALYLADGSAKKEYDDLTETGYYANIISGNISQRIQVDSIQTDLRSEPYVFRCYATLTITRSTSTVTRSLVTQGDLRPVSRSDNNLQGFLIQHWTILENKDLKVVNH
jgi:conjugative transposon TraK protein